MGKVVKKKAGAITKQRRLEIMTQLEKIVAEGSILGATNQQLAVKFGVKRDTISSYLKKIYKKIPQEDIKETEVKIKVMFDKIFRYAQRIMNNAQTTMEQERALRIMLIAMKEFTDFLERFGMKPKVADKIDLQADITQKQFVINYNVPNGNVIESDNNKL